MTALHQAIIGDDRSRVRSLLVRNPGWAVLPFSSDTFFDSGICHWIYIGDTALHLASAGHRVECVRLLLDAGAEVNAVRSRRGGSPLHYAADGFIEGPEWDARRQVLTLRCLLDHGADLHVPDANGATALHRAVRTRCAAAVRVLLGAGADPGAPNHSGSTPFHLAVQNTGRGGSGTPGARRAQEEILREFLARGVSPHLRVGSGKSVMECVRSEWIRRLLS
ncbi:MAG: ankyrin repeat domain-containing protein [Verrucomicrobiota bacterium]